MDNKSNSLMAQRTEFYKYTENFTLRRLTVVECKRLQTVPVWYQMPVSDTQAYKMLGNGFTCDVIAHILAYLK